MANFSFTIANNKEFAALLDRLGKATNDFRIPFRIIASDFYRSQKAIFKLQSEGLYPPLGGFQPGAIAANGLTRRENAETRKERLTGHSWNPILFGESGDLRDSTLSKNHRFSRFFLGRQELQIGSSVPYGPFNQNGTNKSPERQFVFIDGGPADRSKGSGINGRRERWTNIVATHLTQLLTGSI